MTDSATTTDDQRGTFFGRVPAVSIGFPVYNGAASVSLALDALLRQTFIDIEIVISDNCSTDATQVICEAYARRDPRVRYLRHPVNMGAWLNFGFVVTQARAKYFMWAAHDDVWSDDWVERLHAGFRADTVMVCGEIAGVDETGKVIGELGSFGLEGRARCLRYFLLDPWSGKANLIYGLYRTDAVTRHHFDPRSESYFGFDMHFVYRMLGCGRFVHVIGPRLSKLVPKTQASAPRAPFRCGLQLRSFWSYIGGYLAAEERPAMRYLLLLLMPVKYCKLLAGRLLPRIARLLRSNNVFLGTR